MTKLTITDINNRNMAIFMPCEVHDYRPIDDEVKECSECGMYSYLPKKEHKDEDR